MAFLTFMDGSFLACRPVLGDDLVTPKSAMRSRGRASVPKAGIAFEARLLRYGLRDVRRVVEVAVDRERERDDGEQEKKAQGEAQERKVSVRKGAIDVHGAASLVVRRRKTTGANGEGSPRHRSVELA
jgi:hypothetical protein